MARDTTSDLIHAIAERLAAFPPFDGMDAAALAYLARHAEVT